MNPILKAAQTLGSQAELARRLGVTSAFISQLLSGGRPIPIQHAISIERETEGAVRVEDLRPDVDWAVIRNHKRAAPKAAA